MEKAVTWETWDRISIITLNRPEKRNAFNAELISELAEHVAACEKDRRIKVVVITGAGKCFCAGGDLESQAVSEPDDPLERKKYIEMAQQILLTLHRMPKPVIGAIRGVAEGAGLDLALACDMRIGSPKAAFVIGYTSAGVAPDSGGTWLMPRVMGVSKTLEYIYTGDPCTSDEAYRIGLLNRLVPAEQLQEESLKLARKIAKGSPIAYRLSKLQVYKGLGMDLETALAFAMACVTIATGSEDHKEAIRSFAEKKMPDFKDK